MSGILVPLSKLPSQGVAYPKDLEVYVRPLSIGDQLDMDRYGISDSEYFKTLLKGVEVRTTEPFYRNNLLHFDVQFLDLVRRLYSFDVDEEIRVEDCVCSKCKEKFSYSFHMQDISFTDFNPDIFNKEFVLSQGMKDELAITVSPLTTDEYTTMSREFRNITNKNKMLSSMYSEYICACTRDIEGRTFKDLKDRNSFLKEYIETRYTYKDKKILEKIVDETIIKVRPFKVLCASCGSETEVEVTPTSNFQQ